MVSVLYYDRDRGGCERLRKNAKAIIDAASGKLELDLKPVNRAKPFPGDACAADMLLQEPFPFSGVGISTLADCYPDVVEYAMLALESSGLPFDRIILFSPPNIVPGLAKDGIQYLPAHGGNGYLLPKDAQEFVQRIKGWPI